MAASVTSATFGQRVVNCEVCDRPFFLGVMRSAHPEAPELFRPYPGTWLGFMTGEKEGHVTMIGCCSLACAQRFFAERG